MIYVALLDEGVRVWRPVDAERIHDDFYRIVDQPYDREADRWEFEPGDEVICEHIETSEGRVLAATARKGE
jgi:hypothetical protein